MYFFLVHIFLSYIERIYMYVHMYVSTCIHIYVTYNLYIFIKCEVFNLFSSDVIQVFTPILCTLIHVYFMYILLKKPVSKAHKYAKYASYFVHIYKHIALNIHKICNFKHKYANLA